MPRPLEVSPEIQRTIQDRWHKMSRRDRLALAKKSGVQIATLEGWALKLGAKERSWQRKGDEIYSQDEIIEHLHCTRRNILKWIDMGWLKLHSKQGDTMYFAHGSVRMLIMKHPYDLVSFLRKQDDCQLVWIIEMLAGGERGIGSLCSPDKKEENEGGREEDIDLATD